MNTVQWTTSLNVVSAVAFLAFLYLGLQSVQSVKTTGDGTDRALGEHSSIIINPLHKVLGQDQETGIDRS